MGLALGPPRLPDTDRDVPCRPGAALLAKRPHLRETEATPDNASWIAAWSVAPPWGLGGGATPARHFRGTSSTNETAPVSFLTRRNLPVPNAEAAPRTS